MRVDEANLNRRRVIELADLLFGDEWFGGSGVLGRRVLEPAELIVEYADCYRERLMSPYRLLAQTATVLLKCGFFDRKARQEKLQVVAAKTRDAVAYLGLGTDVLKLAHGRFVFALDDQARFSISDLTREELSSVLEQALLFAGLEDEVTSIFEKPNPPDSSTLPRTPVAMGSEVVQERAAHQPTSLEVETLEVTLSGVVEALSRHPNVLHGRPIKNDVGLLGVLLAYVEDELADIIDVGGRLVPAADFVKALGSLACASPRPFWKLCEPECRWAQRRVLRELQETLGPPKALRSLIFSRV